MYFPLPYSTTTTGRESVLHPTAHRQQWGAAWLALGILLVGASLPHLVAAVMLAAIAGAMAGTVDTGGGGGNGAADLRSTYMFRAAQYLQDAAGPAIGTALFAVAAALPWLMGGPVVLGATAALAIAMRRHEAGS